MSDTHAQFERLATELAPLCEHISVRTDEAGLFILAIGLKGTHTLELRQLRDKYILEQWHGATAEVERVVDRPSFSDPGAAIAEAKRWLSKDAV